MQYAKPVTLNVEECDRLFFLPYLFGQDFLYVEASVYALAKKMMPEYEGGFWHFIRLPGGIRSSGLTPTGSCWRTRQSPPNPLARFRAVATVRCVKTPGLQRPFRSRRGLRSWHPGKKTPGCKAQRRFANRASRRCSGSLLIACRVPHTRMSPCRRGLIQPQPAALTVQGK